MSPNQKIRVLVVDDEAPARQRLISMLRQDPSVGAIDQASDGAMAVSMIQTIAPDLVFLDVQMSELDGLQVVEAVGVDRMPLTVFVTAYDQHAVRAFDANALDYLLKPFGDERFEATMARARRKIDEAGRLQFGERLMSLMQPGTDALPPRTRPLDRLVLKEGGSVRFLPVKELDWIEAAGVYVNLHSVGGKAFLYRSALTELEERLGPEQFVRIHRSAMVNIERIDRLDPISHGEFEVVLKSGKRLRLSRTYRSQLETRLGQTL